MDLIDQLSKGIILLINAGVLLRVVFSLVSLISNPDETTVGKRRIFYAVVFCVIANGIYALKDLILKYYQ